MAPPGAEQRKRSTYTDEHTLGETSGSPRWSSEASSAQETGDGRGDETQRERLVLRCLRQEPLSLSLSPGSRGSRAPAEGRGARWTDGLTVLSDRRVTSPRLAPAGQPPGHSPPLLLIIILPIDLGPVWP